MACIAIMGVIVGPTIQIGKCILPPIKRQLNYLCCFKGNIISLREESEKLDDVRLGLEMGVAVAENKAEVILPEVKSWLANATQSQNEVNGIEHKISTMQRGHFITNLRLRYSLSKKAKKMAEAIRHLRDQCNFDPVSRPSPPAALSITINDDGVVPVFGSRMQIEDDIMAALKDESVRLVGIWGMGGVGKTTMANKIMERVKRDNLFDEVVMAVVSQPLDLLKIQLQLMEQLGLDSKKYETIQARSHQLRTRLTSTKRILVVLDDLWQRLDLKDVGLPFASSSTNCKVILTTREDHLLKEMDAKTYEMKSMSNPEAWDFFITIVGDSIDDDPELRCLAKEVAKKCDGLPLALITTGRALKSEKDVQRWQDALLQLKSANPIDMPKVLDGVYKPLKLSYDRLDSENAKSIFRVCGVFPEDYDISLEELTRYGLGLNMIRGGGIFLTLEEVRHRVFTLVGTLKSRSLLLEGQDKYHIKMHDVLRDVAIFIAKTEASPEIDWAAWVLGIPFQTFSSTLCFLAMQNLQEHELPENEWNMFFDEARDLNVLRFESISMRSLPRTTHLLKNLHMLHLIGCLNLKSISIIGELTSLEILSLKYCNSVSKLPSNMGRLKRLRLLEVYSCKSLVIVESGVVSSLPLLEELKIRESFKGWEVGEERRNVSLKELESLTRLSCLEIEIEDVNLAAVEIALPPRIIKFYVEIGKRLIYYRHDYENVVSLDLPGHIVLGNWIRKLLVISRIIELAGDAASNILECFLGSTCLKRLGIYKCSTINASSIRGASFFPVLECLTLVDLCNLERICDGPIPTSSNFLRNLKSLRLEWLPRLSQLWSISPNTNLSLPNLSLLEIKRCYSLENLFQLSRAIHQLESLEIECCNSMKEIFSIEMLSEDERTKTHLAFPKLKNLKIAYLSNLTIFCKDAERIKFPQLVLMEITSLPKLKSLTPPKILLSSGTHDQDSLHFFCDSKVSFDSLWELWIVGVNENIGSLWCRQIPSVHYDFFRKLEKLDLYRCNCLKNLFASPSIASHLVNLKWLDISDFPEMVQVIGDAIEEELVVADENNSDISNLVATKAIAKTSLFNVGEDHENKQYSSKVSPHHIMFPNLEFLWLSHLPKLERFVGQWKYYADGDSDHALVTIEMPSLQILDIYQCGRVERFTVPGIALTTPNLKYIEIDKKDIISTEDVNGALEQRYINLRSVTEDASVTVNEEIQETLRIDAVLVSEGCDFVIGKNGVKIHVSYLVGKIILLYFAGWWKYAWCRDFLPELIEVYQEINAKCTTEEEALQVIFISSDRDEASYDEFFSRMPWLAVPCHDQRIASLTNIFKVRMFPTVVAIGPTGDTLTTDARNLISCYGARAYPFTAERIDEIEAEDDKMTEGWPLQVKMDLLHPHNLLLTKRPTHLCDGCGQVGVWFYRCEECDFDLHKVCALVTDKDDTLPNQELIMENMKNTTTEISEYIA